MIIKDHEDFLSRIINLAEFKETESAFHIRKSVLHVKCMSWRRIKLPEFEGNEGAFHIRKS